jgi:ribonuclease G
MKKEIIVNSSPQETRVAMMENGVLAEIFVERKKEQWILGNIYKGRVLKVLPGMQAAFVDIGLTKAGFLYVADIQELTDEYEDYFLPEGVPIENGDPPAEAIQGRQPPPRIEEMLREGQEIIVQVSKEPLGTKGARLTSRLALPGRYLVYMPGEDHIGISRRITDEAERDRLRALILCEKPQQGGFIVRTLGEGASAEEFRQDLDFLAVLWHKIREKGEKCHAPHLIHSDLDLLLKTIRDHFTGEVDRLLIDNADDHARLGEFVQSFLPHLRSKIELYRRPEPIFDAYDIEIEIGKILDRKVWLKSGGYITIDCTEALVTIDVNTGKYVGAGNFEETILKTNLEAAREIAYQLRLRNLGGIIIIDFIDMEQEKNRARVFKALEESLSGDRSTSKILQISELGLVEMTRKRNRPPLEKTLCQPCPYCKGRGQIKSAQTVTNEILRELVKAAPLTSARSLLVEAHPSVAGTLMEEDRQHIEMLERELGKSILIKANPDHHHEEYDVTPLEDRPEE